MMPPPTSASRSAISNAASTEPWRLRSACARSGDLRCPLLQPPRRALAGPLARRADPRLLLGFVGRGRGRRGGSGGIGCVEAYALRVPSDRMRARVSPGSAMAFPEAGTAQGAQRKVDNHEMSWQAVAFLNAVIAAAYLVIFWVILRGLVTTQSGHDERPRRRDRADLLHLRRASRQPRPASRRAGARVRRGAAASRCARRSAGRWPRGTRSVRSSRCSTSACAARTGACCEAREMFEDSERRRYQERLLRERESLAEAQAVTHLGSWERDLATGERTWSDEMYRMVGLEPGQRGRHGSTCSTSSSRRTAAALDAAMQTLASGGRGDRPHVPAAAQDRRRAALPPRSRPARARRKRHAGAHHRHDAGRHRRPPRRGRASRRRGALPDLRRPRPDRHGARRPATAVARAAAQRQPGAVRARRPQRRRALRRAAGIAHASRRRGDPARRPRAARDRPARARRGAGALPARRRAHRLDVAHRRLRRRRGEPAVRGRPPHGHRRAQALRGPAAVPRRPRLAHRASSTAAASRTSSTARSRTPRATASAARCSCSTSTASSTSTTRWATPSGDELVSRIARLLRDVLRETDVLARLGGDEFADPAQARRRGGGRPRRREAARRVARSRDRPDRAPPRARDGVDRRDDVRRRDRAHRRGAPRRGGHRDVRGQGRGQGSRRRLPARAARRGPLTPPESWLERLRTAIADGQPRAARPADRRHLRRRTSTASSCCCACAATTAELVPPAAFLHVAERFDLIQDIDRWVFEQAARLLGVHAEAGIDIGLSVNFSGKTMSDPGHPRRHRRRSSRAIPSPRAGSSSRSPRARRS